jgi:hypothetical protein
VLAGAICGKSTSGTAFVEISDRTWNEHALRGKVITLVDSSSVSHKFTIADNTNLSSPARVHITFADPQPDMGLFGTNAAYSVDMADIFTYHTDAQCVRLQTNETVLTLFL